MPYNHYWEEAFNAQGTTITGGYLLLGANQDGADHRARIGIYTGSNRSGPLGEVVQQVVGYGAVNFSFPAALNVTSGQRLYIAATGIGDFTAYDQANRGGVEGCFIGRVDGFAPPPPDNAPPVVSQFTFAPSAVEVSHTGQDVTVTLHLADTPAGVKDPGSAVFSGPSTSSVRAPLTRTAGDENSGDYRAVVTIPKDAQPGTWLASLHGITDNANNTLPDGPPPAGSPTRLTVTSTHPDVDPPTITAFDFNPRDINAGDTVHVSITVADTTGSYNTGTDGPERLGFTAPNGHVASAPTRPDPTHAGTYLADVQIPRDGVGGTWTANIINFHDRAGNHGPEGAPPAGLPRDLHVTAAPPPPRPPPTFRYAIANVGGVDMRSGPGRNYPRVGTLGGGWPIDIVCQTVGESINGSRVWDKLNNDAYVADWFTTTPVVGDYTATIARCPGAPDQVHPPQQGGRWRIAATSTVNLRSGPGTGYGTSGTLGPGARFDIACQTYGTYVYGSPIWDRLLDGRYVADYFTDTPVFANFSPGIPVCAGTGLRPGGGSQAGGGGGGGGGGGVSGGGSGGGGGGTSCSQPILFLGVRGSGESGFGDTVAAVNGPVHARFGHDAMLRALDYPAMPIDALLQLRYGAYKGSVQEGVSGVMGYVRRVVDSCGYRVHVLLAGFSQGAWVVGDAIKGLNSHYRNAIRGAVLLGDPKEPYAGIAGLTEGYHASWPPDIRGRIKSYCIPGDPVCSWLTVNPLIRSNVIAWCLALNGLCPHKHYTDSDAYRAGVFLRDHAYR